MTALRSGLLVFSLTWLGLTVCTDEVAAQPRRVKGSGRVVAVVGNQLTVVDEEKTRHTVRPNMKSPLVEVTGPVTAAELQVGMIVRLTGNIKSNELEEVSEVVIHSPVDGYQLGIEQPSKDEPATIVAQFVRVKDGRLTVAVGKRRISARLSDDAKINVDSKDLRFVKSGDAVEFDAYTTNSGILSGRTIKVTKQPPQLREKQPVKTVKQSSRRP